MSLAGQLVPPSNGSRPPVGETIPGRPQMVPQQCHHIDYNYDPLAAVGCCMYIIFGIVYTLFGYRCFKAVMFLTGFTFGSVIVYLICLQEHLLPVYGNITVALSAGLLFGLITMLIQYVGLFMTGLHTGLFVAIGGLATYDHLSEKTPNAVWLCVSTLLGTAILFAILNLCWKKGFTIFGTSIYGGAIIATAIDYLIERLVMVNWVWERVILRPTQPAPCWYSWLILAIWPTAAVLGLTTQACLTSTGIHHEESINARKKRSKNACQRPRTHEQRAEMKQRQYRCLYQVRTSRGDIISQSYVQALQKKAECSTLQSDATHLTILPGAEHPPPINSDSEEECR